MDQNSSPLTAAQKLPCNQETGQAADNPGFFKRNSLQLSGVANLIADFLMMFKGVQEKSKLLIFGGALYTLGGLNLALFGKAKSKEKEKQVAKDTAEFLQEKTQKPVEMIVPEEKYDGSLSKNAARNTLYIYTAGALAFLAVGIKKFRAKEGWGLMAYGASSTLFKAISLLVPEKTTKEKQEEGEGKKGGLINWIREKPLRIFGYGSFVTDTALGITTYQEYKNPKEMSSAKNYRVIGGATIFYLLADYLVAQSNKNPANAAGKLDSKAQRQVESMAAEAIAREPEEKREALVRDVSEFLAARPEMSGKADDICKAITAKMAPKSDSKWTERLAAETPVLQAQPSL